MMPDRKMFWRIIRRLLGANRGRLLVILLALGAGAAITAALLNLQVDAKRRLTTEFRAFGANAIVAPPASADSAPSDPRFLPDSLFADIPDETNGVAIPKAEFLYGAVDVIKKAQQGEQSGKSVQAILAGFFHSGNHPEQVVPDGLLEAERKLAPLDSLHCELGQRVAAALQLRSGDALIVASGSRKAFCQAYVLLASGGAEDSQVFLELPATQALLEQPHHISLIQISVPGSPRQIQNYLTTLQRRLPDVDVRPIRQFTEGEAKIYDRISGILSATVGLVLVLTALCVMAAMTNVAMERRNDVGLMKAIGGATRRVLRLFLAEAAILGLTGGVFGAAIGMLLSMWLGKAVFGVAALPRLIVYPVAVALTIIVSIAGAYPLRRLANIRPAAVFRGEA
jgi:putative ABC transport system permease protein